MFCHKRLVGFGERISSHPDSSLFLKFNVLSVFIIVPFHVMSWRVQVVQTKELRSSNCAVLVYTGLSGAGEQKPPGESWKIVGVNCEKKRMNSLTGEQCCNLKLTKNVFFFKIPFKVS